MSGGTMTGGSTSTALGSAAARWGASVAALVGVAVAVYAAAIVWSGPAQTWEAVGSVGWPGFLAACGIAAAGYVLRFARWHLMLGRLGHRLPPGANLRIYLAGLGLTTSPGKLGETIRSVFLLRHGVRLADSLGAFFADRGADVIGVAMLGALAGLWARQRVPALEVLVPLLIAVSFVLRWLVLGGRWEGIVLRLQERGRAGRWLAAAAFPASAWATLWTPRRVPLYALAAMAAYGLQGLVFAHFVALVAVPLPWAQCLAIYASATLLGAASLVPAGLGVMEATLVLQLTLAGADVQGAVAAALLTRLATLWFGLLLGALALAGLWRPPADAPGQGAS